MLRTHTGEMKGGSAALHVSRAEQWVLSAAGCCCCWCWLVDEEESFAASDSDVTAVLPA